MKTPNPLPAKLKSIGLETLNCDLETESEELLSLTSEAVRKALNAAYKAGGENKTDYPISLDSDIDSSQLFWRLMESLPDHVYFKDLESRFICVNQAHARFHGFKNPDDAVGRSDYDIFQERFARVKYEAEQEIIRTGEGWSFREERDLQSDGSEKWVLTTKLPLKDVSGEIVGTFGLSRDITENKYVELELDRQRHLLQTIIRILPCRVFVRDKEQRFLLINEEYRKGIGAEESEEVFGKRLIEVRPGKRSEVLEARDKEIIRTGQAINNQIEFDNSLMGDNRWVLTSKVPLRGSEGEVEGVVGMTLDITEQKEAEEEARHANELLQEKNQQLETELLVARQLQETLMSMGFDDEPRYSLIGDNWSMEASYLYAPSHHLAGDFFYLIPISEDKVGILVCDVMGHGVKASLVTMLIRGLLLEIPANLANPARVLRHLNEKIIPLADDNAFPRFITAVYTVFNLSKGEIVIANAGHPEPLWYVRDEHGNHFEGCPVREMGPALGLFSEERFKSTRHKLDQMTELLFYTDGLVEQKQSNGEEWGVENLVKSVEKVKDLPLNEQLKSITGALYDCCDSDHLDDDVCLVAVRIKPAK
ncbi:MAG: SpoIIE family protein phosphatase [Verrucomicrobia bacterium]|nr:SpoIIE family protein phosphatase [Verrucomicrobiota bacterium]